MVEISGSVVAETIETIKQTFGEAKYTEILNSLDANDKAMFEKSIMAIGWYSLDHFAKFLEQHLLLALNGDESRIIARSEALFEKQLKGIYRFFIKLSSAEFILKSLSTIHKGYFKGVSIDIKMENPKKALIKYTGFEKQHRIVGLNIIGFYKRALEMSGARDVNPQFTTAIEEDKGYCDLEITWKGK